MKHISRDISETGIWLILISVLSIIMGCAPSTTSYPSSELHIIPLNNKNTIALNANDIVQMMRRVGFSDEQILALGGRMRDSLLHSGAAQLKISNKVEAVFAVNNNFVYVATRLRGSFIYDVKKGRIVSSFQS
jgi:hypothetical protein